ncbi:hypothetical protein TTHERM_000227679 (macronuclear) [Tetrahymena thermophila SB210]|uniref:Uncharacterized protein n=1 Tax=Tetrahymena thermophila (strain SB210) TaxID=312017 RepID=W7X5W0_TETTS|nr:hypothetical protein TTHERM_000227679 [Tetrahymena thermophila SB210]EWS74750.1 hypothetical protein TTHERM_000227679 [Tetrahymena thermophila SB210]|eukprot:XP_012652751.1 hypothetical protein TTHERM_000227679 [Tetrahymena thermophila SB210]
MEFAIIINDYQNYQNKCQLQQKNQELFQNSIITSVIIFRQKKQNLKKLSLQIFFIKYQLIIKVLNKYIKIVQSKVTKLIFNEYIQAIY